MIAAVTLFELSGHHRIGDLIRFGVLGGLAVSSLVACTPNRAYDPPPNDPAGQAVWLLAGAVEAAASTSPRPEEGAPDQPILPREGLAARPHVEREQDANGHGVLRATASEPPFVLGFEWRAASGDVVQTTWIVPARLRGETRASCAPKLMLDGELAALGASRHQLAAGRDVFHIALPTATVEKLVRSKVASGRVCDDEWRLGVPSRAVLVDFVALMRVDAFGKTAEPAAAPK
jgi:hypothetical protein